VSNGSIVGGKVITNTGVIQSGTRSNFFLQLQSDRNMVLYDNGTAIWASNTGLSDIRLKENIKPLTGALDSLDSLSAIRFNWKDKKHLGTQEEIGVIAQEVERIYPSLVYNPSSGYKLVDYSKLSVVLLSALKELKAQVGVYKDRITILNNGNVGIGTQYPTSRLYVAGNFTATGTKNFEINHPTKPGKKLVHAAIEGPEAAVYYRGEGKLIEGKAIIELPDYFEALTRKEGRTVQLTAKGTKPYLLSASEVKDGKFTVYGTEPDGEFYWEVKAVRADVEPLQVEK
jgi:hypothetical protein